MSAFDLEVRLDPLKRNYGPDTRLLHHLEAMTFDFERDGEIISCVLVYAEPDEDISGPYRLAVAAESGFEGLACLDDTARAANLALAVYERNRSAAALRLARRWLTFVGYMQYSDGDFANFVRNAAGVRNASAPTSVKGGWWWSVRARWALARAYRLTGDQRYLERYERCRLGTVADAKLQAVMALAAMELYAVEPAEDTRRAIKDHADFIVSTADRDYFRDQPENERISMWGYHQLHAVASASRLLGDRSLLPACRQTVTHLVEPAVRDRFWHEYPSCRKDGVCAYDVGPLVQGLAAMYRVTEARRYLDLGLQASAWFYGRNDARTAMYDPTTGRCRDGITNGEASLNFGAESSIEAGFAELERRALLEAR